MCPEYSLSRSCVDYRQYWSLLQSLLQLFGLAEVVVDFCDFLIDGVNAIQILLANLLINDCVVRQTKLIKQQPNK